MSIYVVPRAGLPSEMPAHTFVLRSDNWDDFGYSTLYELHYFNDAGERIELGGIKVMRRGQTMGGHAEMPTSPFHRLTDDYCAVGQDQRYYEAIYALPSDIRKDFLKRIRDCAFDLSILKTFEDDEVFNTSLCRFIRKSDISRLFHSILMGNIAQTAFNFRFLVPPSGDAGLTVSVEPHSLPPSNVHVLIGRNGVGKTRLLADMIDVLTGHDDDAAFGIKGKIDFPGFNSEEERFTSLVSVAFSAFDKLMPVAQDRIAGSVKYAYVGLKKTPGPSRDVKNAEGPDTSEGDSSLGTQLKSEKELEDEFRQSLENCVPNPRLERWLRAINLLTSDPILADYDLARRMVSEGLQSVVQVFETLSSGHKIVLLTVTRLVELVDEKTLVLIDEPETHLHPPLLASFTNVISDLLIARNGVALIATHSPVVLQEVPTSCVTILNRSGSEYSFLRPDLETYGENVGTLTREVFSLEVLESGFHAQLKKSVSELGYEGLLREFNGQIGSEGRALARLLNTTLQQGEDA
ncbi:AAA family ATPase [Asticcacaulis sp.]|uniref:AAA family ATPase n=1 Tax=Asticcacaulis sp. TaxID=1872648 RepID=UPI0026356363|nr:AAA family ATPase [Asticcacaulis sp.]